MERSGVQRKLTAILAADVAGYGRLMGHDEEATLVTLRACRRVIDRLVANHRGRVFGSAGDSMIAEFASPVEAVRCAVGIQEKLGSLNADLPEDRRMRFRIGVNLGDVMVEGDNLLGDGVNIAARLEALAEPGGVCVSGSVFEQVKGKLDAAFQDMGEREVKNIAEPVRVYRIRIAEPVSRSMPSASDSLPLPDKPSIAVLPFTNMSGDPEQEYFSDGITEDIITELSKFHELFVIARNSSFVYRDRAVNIQEVGRELGVRNILEGSVRKAAGRVRITAQLVDATTGEHLWAERYDRGLDDIFAVQDEVSQTIVATLVERMAHIGAERARRKPPAEQAAYDLLLRGRVLFHKWNREDNREARDMFTAAVDRDPHYAEAQAYLAMTHFADWIGGWSKAPDETFAQFCDLAERAVALGDAESYPNVVFALAQLYRRRHDEARFHVGKALNLNPSDADIHMFAGYVAMFDGDHDESVSRIDQAARINPFGRYGLALGHALFSAKRYVEAIAALKTVRAKLHRVHALLAASHAHAGADAQARSAASRLIEVVRSEVAAVGAPVPASWSAFLAERFPYKVKADLDHLLDGLRKAGLSE